MGYSQNVEQILCGPTEGRCEYTLPVLTLQLQHRRGGEPQQRRHIA